MSTHNDSFDSERSTIDESEYDSILPSLPFPEYKYPPSAMATVLSKVISLSTDTQSNKKSHFTASQIPSISIEDYLERILYYARPEPSTLICSLIYIDRLCSVGKITLTNFNVHRVIFTSVFLSIKYNEDEKYKIDYYAQIGGMSVQEILVLESEFVSRVDFNFYINEEEYKKYSDYIKTII